MLSDLYLTSVKLEESLSPDSYLNNLPAVRYLACSDGLQFNSRVTIFVCENGVGKSTLIEAIAIAMGFNPEGGTRNFSFSTEDTHSELSVLIRCYKGYRHPKDGFFLRAESFYNATSYLDDLGYEAIVPYGGVSLHGQSHGESFMTVVKNRFSGKGLYILDEPEAALSPNRVLELMACIDRLAKDNSQFIIATHSPMLMALPGAQVLLLSDKGIEPVEYEETEHFTVMKSFLNAPEKMCSYLFGEE